MKKLLFLLPLFALAGCSAIANETKYTCAPLATGDVVQLYTAKANCIGKKAQLIREGNMLFQDRKDESLATVKAEIADIDKITKEIDGAITNSLPRTFR